MSQTSEQVPVIIEEQAIECFSCHGVFPASRIRSDRSGIDRCIPCYSEFSGLMTAPSTGRCVSGSQTFHNGATRRGQESRINSLNEHADNPDPWQDRGSFVER
jgi:protein-arginine kinase activator protein McsA